MDVTPNDFDLLMNLEHWPNYVRVRDFIQLDKRGQGTSAENSWRPNKIQRTNNINVSNDAGSAYDNQELGFQQGAEELRMERTDQIQLEKTDQTQIVEIVE